MSFDHTKTMDLKCTLPLVDLTMLAQLAGKPLTTGEAVILPKKEILTASVTNTITLSETTPAVGTLQVYLLSGDRDLGIVQAVGTPATAPNTYSIAVGGVITLNTTTAPVGTKFIAFYDYTSGVTVTQVTFTANDFPGYMRVTGEGLATDFVTGNVVPTLFDVKKCKLQSNFSITMSSTKVIIGTTDKQLLLVA